MHRRILTLPAIVLALGIFTSAPSAPPSAQQHAEHTWRAKAKPAVLGIELAREVGSPLRRDGQTQGKAAQAAR